MTDDLITLKEAAAILGFTGHHPTRSVTKHIERGRLRAVPAGDALPRGRGYTAVRTRLVRRADVLALRDELRQTAEARARALGA